MEIENSSTSKVWLLFVSFLSLSFSLINKGTAVPEVARLSLLLFFYASIFHISRDVRAKTHTETHTGENIIKGFLQSRQEADVNGENSSRKKALSFFWSFCILFPFIPTRPFPNIYKMWVRWDLPHHVGGSEALPPFFVKVLWCRAVEVMDDFHNLPPLPHNDNHDPLQRRKHWFPSTQPDPEAESTPH